MAAGSHDPLSTSWAELLREKRSLAAIVRDAGKLCVADAVDILLDVCDALANAHANGIVHGDLGLHRVRTMWPRCDGDHVEIFALDADDTGAIDFRAAFAAPALAPEQRAGRIGDQRSDIWALGAILHALVGGMPPSRRPAREVLAGAPRALITCVEACLADNPDERPRSVDDVAGALASFASNSADRFQTLARRRIASLKAKHVNEKVGTLGLLDELAVKRASEAPFRAASAIPAAPITAPLPQAGPRNETFPPPRMASRPSYSSYPGNEGSTEWPAMHGVPSMSVAVPPAAPYPPVRSTFRAAAPMAPSPSYVAAEELAHVHSKDAPTSAAPVTYPSASVQAAPAYSKDAPTTAAPAAYPPASAEAAPTTVATPPMTPSPMTYPSVAAPSGVRVPNPRATAPLFNPALYPAAASSIPMAHAPSMTPRPVSYESPAYVPPPAPAYRAGSYHPPSIGPVSLDVGMDAAFPPPARLPSFSDLAEYREAKRASRKTAILAVVAAAAVIILGFGAGSSMLAKDRAAVHAAQAGAVAPAPPPPAMAVPAPSATPAPSAAPASSVAPAKSATPAPPKKTAAPVTKRRAAAPTSEIPTTSKDDRPDVASSDALSGALGKKDAAPAGALTDALK